MSGRMKVLVAGGAALALLLAAIIGYWAASLSVSSVNVGMTSQSPTLAPPTADTLGTSQMQRGAPEGGETSKGDASIEVPKAVIRTASMQVRVDDVPKALASLRGTVSAAGGELQSLTYSAGNEGPITPLAEGDGDPVGPKSATAIIRVPSDKLASVSTKLAGLGTVLTQSASEEDVTQEVIDVAARLKNLRAEEARLRSFFVRAKNVREMLSIERELARVRGEIESLQAQADYLKRQTSMATLTVELTEPGPIVSPSGSTWGFAEAVTDGIRAAVRLLGILITVVIALSPVIAFGLLIWFLLRARARRKTRSEQPASE